MNKRILLFNVVYYGITILLMTQLTQNGGGALGIVIMMLVFWGIALVFLITLLLTKKITVKSTFDKIGIFSATPVIEILYLTLLSR